jgi:hypothetical protein
MNSFGNVMISNDSYVSNRRHLGDGKPAVRLPSPGRPNVFQKTWEDFRNGNCSNNNFPVTLKLSDVIEGYRVLLRGLPDLEPVPRTSAYDDDGDFDRDHDEDDEESLYSNDKEDL